MVAQNAELNTVEKLLATCEEHEDTVHEYFSNLFLARYFPGPLKTHTRIQSKADNDYSSEVHRVVDCVRGSAIFDSIVDYTAALVLLSANGRGSVHTARRESTHTVLRVKDRVTTPLKNGCE